MTSIIFRTATRYMFPLLFIFSIYLLLRGHHYPGGGFVGGLFAGSAFTLYALAYSVSAARKLLSIDSRDITAIGLAVALCSGIPALFTDHPFLTGVWVELPYIEIGTPLIFDTGVYLVVFGVLLTFVYSLGEEE